MIDKINESEKKLEELQKSISKNLIYQNLIAKGNFLFLTNRGNLKESSYFICKKQIDSKSEGIGIIKLSLNNGQNISILIEDNGIIFKTKEKILFSIPTQLIIEYLFDLDEKDIEISQKEFFDLDEKIDKEYNKLINYYDNKRKEIIVSPNFKNELINLLHKNNFDVDEKIDLIIEDIIELSSLISYKKITYYDYSHFKNRKFGRNKNGDSILYKYKNYINLILDKYNNIVSQ